MRSRSTSRQSAPSRSCRSKYCARVLLPLRAHNTDTLVLLGHATRGGILSTVRYAADADYRLVVVTDGRADRDAEVHTQLMQRVLLHQATVVSAAAVPQALSGR